MFNVRARYDWTMQGSYNAYAWVGANHIGAQSNQPQSFPDGNDPAQNPPTTTLLRYSIPGYTTYDAGIGVAKDNWNATITATNLSNSDAVSNISSGQFIKSEIPIRPRVITFGIRLQVLASRSRQPAPGGCSRIKGGPFGPPFFLERMDITESSAGEPTSAAEIARIRGLLREAKFAEALTAAQALSARDPEERDALPVQRLRAALTWDGSMRP